MLADGVLCCLEYGIAPDERGQFPYLAELLDAVGGAERIIDGAGEKSISALNVLEKVRSENLTIREVYNWYAGARGQRTLRGGAKRIADEMEEWFVNYGVDGFLIQPAHLPNGLNAFTDFVIPQLVKRGLFRSDYESTTLRGNLRLLRPSSRHSAQQMSIGSEA